MKLLIYAILVTVSLFRVDVVYTGESTWLLWGDPAHITYDPVNHVWYNRNTEHELWRLSYPELLKPEQVPERKELKVSFDPLFWRRENTPANVQAVVVSVVAVSNRRLHLINVEESINESRALQAESRCWPHLGILYVGTVATEEGWDVLLHDELVQGYVDLVHIVQPGDVVGLSLVVTGIERGVELARQAKQLGARYVIVGNDSAIFRVDQLLRLPGHPIDAVFTTNSLTPVRQFLRTIDSAELHELAIPDIAVMPRGIDMSNERHAVQRERQRQRQLQLQGAFYPEDVFVVPRLGLFPDAYWRQVWQNYRTTFGHKHSTGVEVRNALALFAQGCTRTGKADVCSYCTIAGVADIRMPSESYLEQVLSMYESFGINYVFNATDSALEMRHVVSMLKKLGAHFPEGLMIYGRAWGLANRPQLIDEWLSLTGGRLLVNVGMDSGDEHILHRGICKASQSGSRLDENRRAVRNVAASGAHLHYSLIFGSPGETKASCEASLEFFEWTRSVLGRQLDQCETDLYWLNHGSPVSRVFRDYAFAQELARMAGKEISRTAWKHRFYRYRDTLVVPWECEEAWYEHFTAITLEEAQAYNAEVSRIMATHEGAAPGRPDMCRTAFKPRIS